MQVRARFLCFFLLLFMFLFFFLSIFFLLGVLCPPFPFSFFLSPFSFPFSPFTFSFPPFVSALPSTSRRCTGEPLPPSVSCARPFSFPFSPFPPPFLLLSLPFRLPLADVPASLLLFFSKPSLFLSVAFLPPDSSIASVVPSERQFLPPSLSLSPPLVG